MTVQSFIKALAKSYLRRRGLTIAPIDHHKEKVSRVENLWLQHLGIHTVIDVGASNGGFAGRARAIFPDAMIYAFEPLGHSFNDLKEKFRDDKNFSAFQIAVRHRKEEVAFYENEYSGSSSLLKMADLHKEAYPYPASEKKIFVKGDTLDNIFHKTGLREKVMLKVDVQGAENLVLEGARETLSKVFLIFSEVSFNTLYRGQILFNGFNRMVEKEGFFLAGIENISRSTVDGAFLQGDAFYLRKSQTPTKTT